MQGQALSFKRTAFQLHQVSPGFPQPVSPQKFHCCPGKTQGTALQGSQQADSVTGSVCFWEGVCRISQNLVASDLVAVRHVTGVRQGEKQSTVCQALLSALQKHMEEKSIGWARSRFSEGRVEHGFGRLSLFLIQEKQIRQSLGPGLFEQILFIGQQEGDQVLWCSSTRLHYSKDHLVV